uniref:Uncharacterized protein n=1 Tax=Arundo donax TaxID=35708 RepID=A0A0A8XTB1_ARUDO
MPSAAQSVLPAHLSVRFLCPIGTSTSATSSSGPTRGSSAPCAAPCSRFTLPSAPPDWRGALRSRWSSRCLRYASSPRIVSVRSSGERSWTL